MGKLLKLVDIIYSINKEPINQSVDIKIHHQNINLFDELINKDDYSSDILEMINNHQLNFQTVLYCVNKHILIHDTNHDLLYWGLIKHPMMTMYSGLILQTISNMKWSDVVYSDLIHRFRPNLPNSSMFKILSDPRMPIELIDYLIQEGESVQNPNFYCHSLMVHHKKIGEERLNRIINIRRQTWAVTLDEIIELPEADYELIYSQALNLQDSFPSNSKLDKLAKMCEQFTDIQVFNLHQIIPDLKELTREIHPLNASISILEDDHNQIISSLPKIN